jgi:hypothetical protein
VTEVKIEAGISESEAESVAVFRNVKAVVSVPNLGF